MAEPRNTKITMDVEPFVEWLDGYAKLLDNDFSHAFRDIFSLGDACLRDMASIKPLCLEIQSRAGQDIRSPEEGEKWIAFQNLRRIMKGLVMPTGFPIGNQKLISIPKEMHERLKREAAKDGRTLRQYTLFRVWFGIAVMEETGRMEHQVVNAISQDKADKSNFWQLTQAQNFVNHVHGLINQIRGRELDQFEEVKRNFLEKMEALQAQEVTAKHD